MSIKVKILPHGIEVAAAKGETLSHAVQRAGIPLEAACGGQGTCGRCVVQVVEGHCDWPGSRILPAKKVKAGFVLSCKAVVTESLVVQIPESMEVSRGDFTPYLVPEAEPALQGALSPMSVNQVFKIPPPEEGGSDLDRFRQQVTLKGGVECTAAVLRNLPGALRRDDGTVTATVAELDGRPRIIRLVPGRATHRHFGVACDIGTTTVALKLVDLSGGEVLDTVAAYNDQIACGADVISRIVYSQGKDHLAELTRRVVGTINGLLGAVLQLQGVSPDEVTSAVFAGNTTMTHLALGIDPRHLREAPYVPALKSVPLLSAGDLGLHIHPDAPVLFSPSVGSYVGGDITAGILCTRLRQESHSVELFIDIGTNGELVISGNGWTIGCACSAGPAFEGVGIECGMRAAAGAIEGIDIQEGGEKAMCWVIGGDRPRGICGSGLIELVASLFSGGILGRDGKFSDRAPASRMIVKGRRRSFVVVPAEHTATGRDIVISEQDIANIMRAKAAIFSACALLLKKVGLSFQHIEKAYIAGGFGCSLNIRKAILIGMFPDIDPGRFEYLGNTSLLGAYFALISAEQRARLAEIAKGMTYVDLSSEPNYMDAYTAALFLPHTDASLFPSVAKKAL